MTTSPVEHTTIRLHNDLSLELSRQERLRLLIRVMCELVAYGEDEATDVRSESSAASTRETQTSSR